MVARRQSYAFVVIATALQTVTRVSLRESGFGSWTFDIGKSDARARRRCACFTDEGQVVAHKRCHGALTERALKRQSYVESPPQCSEVPRNSIAGASPPTPAESARSRFPVARILAPGMPLLIRVVWRETSETWAQRVAIVCFRDWKRIVNIRAFWRFMDSIFVGRWSATGAEKWSMQFRRTTRSCSSREISLFWSISSGFVASSRFLGINLR